MKYIKTCILLFALAIMQANLSIAQETDDLLIIGKEVTIKSKVLKEKRLLWIYTPANYDKTQEKYPVLYLLDGSFHFYHSAGLIHWLSEIEYSPKFIIVGITNIDRRRDFTPKHVDWMPTSGQAEKFTTFLDEELIPFIDKNYRTEKYKIIEGHSLGGAFVLHTFLYHNDLFNAYMAFSPAIRMDNVDLIDYHDFDFNSIDLKNDFLYLSIEKGAQYIPDVEQFIHNLKESKTEKLCIFKYEKFNEESHSSMPHISMNNAMRYLFKDWVVSEEVYARGIDSVIAHYDRLESFFNYPIKIPEYIYRSLGKKYLKEEKNEFAVKAFKENLRIYPEIASSYFYLGEAYEKMNDYPNALIYFEKAFTIAKTNFDRNIIQYQEKYVEIKMKVGK